MKPNRIQFVTRLVAGVLGEKALSISHLSEKMHGFRAFTLADLDCIQAAIASEIPQLWELWIEALTGRNVLDLARMEAAPNGRTPQTAALQPPTFLRRQDKAA